MCWGQSTIYELAITYSGPLWCRGWGRGRQLATETVSFEILPKSIIGENHHWKEKSKGLPKSIIGRKGENHWKELERQRCSPLSRLWTILPSAPGPLTRPPPWSRWDWGSWWSSWSWSELSSWSGSLLNWCRDLWGVLKLLVRFRASGSNEPRPPDHHHHHRHIIMAIWLTWWWWWWWW